MITAKTFVKAAHFILIILIFVSAIEAAPGDVDPGFHTAAYACCAGFMNDAVVQPDGKIIVGGAFAVANETARQGIVRLNADGTLDPTFRAPDFQDTVQNSFGGTVYAVKLQADGKILVGGQFTVVNSTYKNIVRLNPDGSLDTTFFDHSSHFSTLNSQGNLVTDIEIQANGAIIVGGNFSYSGENYSSQQVIRLDGATGAVDTSFHFVNFGGTLRDLAVQPDGKILVSDLNMFRVNVNGSVDNTFPTVASGGIEKILVRADGKIIIGGNFTTVNGFQQWRVSQVNSDGSFDTNFNSNNLGADGIVNDMAFDASGKILIAGNFANYNGVPRNKIARLNADGSLDASFTTTAPSYEVRTITPLSSGQIFIGGYQNINRINPDGSYDLSLNQPRLGTIGGVRDVIQQPDGKLIIAGGFNTVLGVTRNNIARLNLDGSLDTSFTSPFVGNIFVSTALGLQSDGKILVGLTGLYRLNPNGTRDTSFTPMSPVNSTSFAVNDIKVYPDDKILVNGYYKMLLNGADDPAFNPPTINGTIFSAVIQPDGKIIIGGDFTQIASTPRNYIARLNADGSLDTSFNTQIGANAPVLGVDLQPDGKVIAVGRFTFMNNNPTKQYIARLNSDGSLDASFSSVIGVSSNPLLFAGLYTVKIQPDGKILIGGPLTSVNGIARNNYARLNSNGSLDTTLNAVPGADGIVRKIKLQADNKILLGGDFTKINNISKIGLVRLLNPPSVLRTQFDYDGDGRADISVFRPSENKWYVLRSSDGAVTQQVFAIAGDVPVPADYDGDGKTDFAIFRPSSGDWWYLSSVNSAQVFAHWGQSGDVPRPSDFDGDGKADYIFFRPSDSFWHRYGSSSGASIQNFGLAGDKPVTGDFDGDGKADKAIFRPSTGDWWWQSSVDNVQRATHWGISTDIPAPADYDADGKTDFAVYRPSTGTWYIYNSGTLTSTILNFGISEDKPIPADYDGDGRADIAVFRPSSGIWYLMKSSEGFTALQFGVSTDTPTENAFVP
ncbi:MAG TPA: FG-GAP-like repeat-containing protein [Pyrinomonadaceae bacterium]|jgi:uncharacterized delta-60 repeat protein